MLSLWRRLPVYRKGYSQWSLCSFGGNNALGSAGVLKRQTLALAAVGSSANGPIPVGALAISPGRGLAPVNGGRATDQLSGQPSAGGCLGSSDIGRHRGARSPGASSSRPEPARRAASATGP